MSLPSVEHHTTSPRVASRRNVVRGAAWTGAAVTVVVATPNVAAASTPKATLQTLSIQRSSQDANVHFVTWVIRISNTGTIPLTPLQGVFGGVSGVTELTVTSTGGQWTGAPGNLTTRTFSGSIPAKTSLDVTVVFKRSNNSKGTATASFLSGGSAVSAPLSATYS